MKHICQLVIALIPPVLCVAQTAPSTLPVGRLKADIVIKFSDETTLREPDGPRVQYKHGFRVFNVQEITFKNFDDSGKDNEVNLVETKDGQPLRQESTVK